MTEQLARTGHITAIGDGVASIRVHLPHRCTSCRSRAACASGSADSATVVVPVPVRARAGDRVTLSLAGETLAAGASLAYLLPALATLLGALALVEAGDAAAVAGAGVGLGIGLVAVRALGRRLSRRAVLTATLAVPRDSHSQSVGDSHDHLHA